MFQTKSIMMVSRALLGLQYGTTWWHIHKFKSAKASLAVIVGANMVAGMVHVGVGFGFYGGGRSLLATWFVIIAVGVSYVWKLLSFSAIHLSNCVMLLTCILICEGVVAVCLTVTPIVTNNPWVHAAIGNVTAGIANIYIIYMVYFGW